MVKIEKRKMMRGTIGIWWIILLACSMKGISQNAPLTTAGTVTSSATTAVVPITVVNFITINSFAWQINYNSAVATATQVTKSPLLSGGYNANISSPGVIIIGWYAYPPDTVPDNTAIFTITFTKVTNGTTALTWYDDGYSCYYSSPAGILNDSPTSGYYFNGSLTFGVPLVADFTASTTTPPKNATVQFTDLTTGAPTSWTWSFNRPSVNFVNGTNANSQNPQVQFTEGGLYTVTLVAQKTGYTDTKIKTDYIRAGAAGIWTGATSSAWTTTTNWENWLIPVSTTDVVIPSSASSWPVYTGDLTIGSTCKSITMNGSSVATVNGNFMINAGASLVLSGTGTFKVAGNWTNSGNFGSGTGTVEFIGPGPATIFSGGSPPVMNSFYDLTVSKTGVSLIILPDIIVNGNLVINP
jgi:PKD repeat protein